MSVSDKNEGLVNPSVLLTPQLEWDEGDRFHIAYQCIAFDQVDI